MNELSNKDKKQFSQIFFTLSENQRNQQIQKMTSEQKKKFKLIIAQKIINDTTRKEIQIPKDKQDQFSLLPTSPGFLATICCCLFPQNNRHNFDITSKIFIRRFFGVFLIWKSNFLKFGIPKNRTGKRLKDDPNDKVGIIRVEQQLDSDGRNNTPDLYGPLWLTILYIILLSFCSNLNNYFSFGTNDFQINSTLIEKIMGLVIFFNIIQSLSYGSIVKSLKGNMSTTGSICLVGYSQILYFIPTILSIIPSYYLHLTVLAIGGVMKTIFLYRNFGGFAQSRKYTLLIVFAVAQFIYFFSLMRTVFQNHKGYNLSEGTKAVFGHAMFKSIGLRNYHQLQDIFY